MTQFASLSRNASAESPEFFVRERHFPTMSVLFAALAAANVASVVAMLLGA